MQNVQGSIPGISLSQKKKKNWALCTGYDFFIIIIIE